MTIIWLGSRLTVPASLVLLNYYRKNVIIIQEMEQFPCYDLTLLCNFPENCILSLYIQS